MGQGKVVTQQTYIAHSDFQNSHRAHMKVKYSKNVPGTGEEGGSSIGIISHILLNKRKIPWGALFRRGTLNNICLGLKFPANIIKKTLNRKSKESPHLIVFRLFCIITINLYHSY